MGKCCIQSNATLLSHKIHYKILYISKFSQSVIEDQNKTGNQHQQTTHTSRLGTSQRSDLDKIQPNRLMPLFKQTRKHMKEHGHTKVRCQSRRNHSFTTTSYSYYLACRRNILELLLQVNAVSDSNFAAAPLSGIDTHSHPPWRGPPSLLLCSAYYKAV